MPRTIRRPAGDTVVAPAGTYAPRATGRAPRPAVPSPAQRPYIDERPDVVTAVTDRAAGPLTLVAALALSLLALALRLAAIVLAVVVVASAVLTGAHRAALVKALNLASWVVPAPLFGQFVFETPFGGALRGDLIIVSLLLFVLDWACLRCAASLRERRARR